MSLPPLPSNPPITPSPKTESENLRLSYIAQLDGNDSIVSESEEIPQITKGRVKQDKLTSAQYLPVVATYNCRSIFPKLGNIKKDILERNIQAGFCCEIWEQKENKNHQLEIENMLESDGLKYISTPKIGLN